MLFFFFSSRRRHTRYWRDWSSDVCSSDLAGLAAPLAGADPPAELVIAAIVATAEIGAATEALAECRAGLSAAGLAVRTAAFSSPSWGRDVVRLASREN